MVVVFRSALFPQFAARFYPLPLIQKRGGAVYYLPLEHRQCNQLVCVVRDLHLCTSQEWTGEARSCAMKDMPKDVSNQRQP
jgi:hypothetical protein